MDGCYCTRCDRLVGLDGLHVTAVEEVTGRRGLFLRVAVESPARVEGCRICGVVMRSHGRRDVRLIDTPCFGRPVELVWRKRIWHCAESTCPGGVVTEQDDGVARPRALLSTRACWWAIRQIRREHASVLGLARQLGTTWRTVWRAIEPLLQQMAADESRFGGVNALGVDEHVWHHVSTKPIEDGGRGPKELTGMVDLSRDSKGRTRARLLDLVPGRSGAAYADWLKARNETFRAGIKVATLDPFHGYKNALDDELEDAVAVLDAFHVVKLGIAAVDEVRRRVQQETLGHRGRKGDPLYGIQNVRRAGPRVVPVLPDPGDQAARQDPQAMARGVPGLLRHSPVQQRRDGGDQRADRAPPPRRPRLPQPRQVPATHAAHRRRTQPHPPQVRRAGKWLSKRCGRFAETSGARPPGTPTSRWWVTRTVRKPSQRRGLAAS
jgi:transposase